MAQVTRCFTVSVCCLLIVTIIIIGSADKSMVAASKHKSLDRYYGHDDDDDDYLDEEPSVSSRSMVHKGAMTDMGKCWNDVLDRLFSQVRNIPNSCCVVLGDDYCPNTSRRTKLMKNDRQLALIGELLKQVAKCSFYLITFQKQTFVMEACCSIVVLPFWCN